MNIGIAGPIEINSLKQHIPTLTEQEEKLGLGGTAINIIIDGLIKAGHNVTVFTLDTQVKEKKVIYGKNIKIIFGHFRISKLKTFDFCRKELLQIKHFIELEKNDLDIVNAHWSYEFAIGTILANVNHLITFRDDSIRVLKLLKTPYRFTRLLMDFWVRKNGQNFSFNSDYLKQRISLKGAVIPNPVTKIVAKYNRSLLQNKQTIDIFFIANGWGEIKNPITAIKAFSILKKRYNNIYLHFFGKGYEKGNYNYNKIKGIYDFENIIWHGYLPHNELISQYNNCDILLHTSREESFGNTLIEAMCFGIPIVAGENSGAVPWVLNYGKAGVLVNVENPEDVSNGLLKLISDKSYYNYMSENALENVRNRFTQVSVVTNYVKEYIKIMKNK